MIGFYLVLPALLAAVASALPHSIGACPGAAQRPTGRGYAAFRYAQGHWAAEDVLGERGPKPYENVGADTLIDCTNKCEARGAACIGVSFADRGKRCDLWTKGYVSEVDPNYADFVPRKFEGSAVRGTCAVEGAAMRSVNNAPFECCEIWY